MAKGYTNVHDKQASKTGGKSVFTGGWDWKDHEGGLDAITKALKEHGLHMQQSPMTAGSDTYGFHISNKKLSSAELKRRDKEERGG